jgi:hypothetical protein
MLRDGANTACQSRLSGRHQTQIFASPPVRTTANTNFRISACHGYPERRLHTTNYQHCLSGRRQTPIFASPLVTATPKDVYTHQLASRRPRAQQLLQKALYTAPATRTPAAGQAATTCAAAPPPCVLRLPYERQPRASRRPRAQQLLQTLCNAPATRTPVAGHAGQPATKRAAAPPEGSA